MDKHYIKAVVELILAGQDINQVLKNLDAVLVNKGHQSIRLKILEGVHRTLAQKQTALKTKVVVAKSVDEKKLQNEITTSLKAIGGELQSADIEVDESLAGGYVVTHQGHKIDASYKTKLLKLYRTITT